jgi:cell division protein FtsB
MWVHLRQFLKNPNLRSILLKTLWVVLLFGVTFYGAYGMAKSYIKTTKEKNKKTKELRDIENRLNLINSESAINNDFQKEKALREKLHMVKPGEDLIIIVPEDGGDGVKN